MNTDHVVLNYAVQPNRVECRACGYSEDLNLPMPATDLGKMVSRIIKAHRRCAPNAPKEKP